MLSMKQKANPLLQVKRDNFFTTANKSLTATKLTQCRLEKALPLLRLQVGRQRKKHFLTEIVYKSLIPLSLKCKIFHLTAFHLFSVF